MTIDFSLPVPEPRAEVLCPFFKFAPWDLSAPVDIPADASTFRVLYAAEGSASLAWGGGAAPLANGRAALVPAGVAVRVAPEGRVRLLVTELGATA